MLRGMPAGVCEQGDCGEALRVLAEVAFGAANWAVKAATMRPFRRPNCRPPHWCSAPGCSPWPDVSRLSNRVPGVELVPPSAPVFVVAFFGEDLADALEDVDVARIEIGLMGVLGVHPESARGALEDGETGFPPSACQKPR